MPKVARKKSSSGYHHIVLRGINKQNLFYDDEDREVFLNRLKLAKEKEDYQIIAFCLMTNHVHLLLKEGSKSIGAVIMRFLSSYVYWYNSKYERVGHLFQSRFKSEPIDIDGHLLYCVRYILQNPVKAGISDTIWEYKWSSGALFLEGKTSFLDVALVKEMFQTQDELKKFMEEQETVVFIEWESKIKLTDDKLKQKILNKLKLDNIYDIMQMTITDRNKALKKILQIKGASALQISRITGVPYHFIRYAK